MVLDSEELQQSIELIEEHRILQLQIYSDQNTPDIDEKYLRHFSIPSDVIGSKPHYPITRQRSHLPSPKDKFLLFTEVNRRWKIPI